MRYILLFYLCLLQLQVAAQHCACADNFRYMVEKMEKNYVGFNDKVTAQSRNAYRILTDSLLRQAGTADMRTCLSLMSGWLSFFKDGHVSVFVNEDSSNYQLIREMYSNTERVPLSRREFSAYLDKNAGKLDSLEGIWEDETGAYQLGIIHVPGAASAELLAFVLKADSLYWLPGQVKAKFSKEQGRYRIAAYYNRTHAYSTPQLSVKNKYVFNIAGYGNWYRKYPAGPAMEQQKLANDRHPCFRIIDSTTCLLAIPSARLDYKGQIDSLLKANETLIKRTPHFIIDLRDNGGGSVLCFEKLLPLIYTRPFISEGASVLATPDNIRDYYAITDYPNISDSMKNVFKKEAEVLWAHEGQLYNLWPNDTLKFDTVFPFPGKVSVLINGNCASSTELFLLKARQSDKVTIYGQHTLGAVDYADAATSRLPCGFFRLRYATSRSNRLPKEHIDNIGLQPDVLIPEQVKDWVQYVRIL